MFPKTARLRPVAVLLVAGLLLGVCCHGAVRAQQAQDDEQLELRELEAMADRHAEREATHRKADLEAWRGDGGPSDRKINKLVDRRREEARKEFIARWGGRWSDWKGATWDAGAKKWTGWPEQRGQLSALAARHAQELLDEAARAMGYPSLKAMNLGVGVRFDPTLPRGSLARFAAYKEVGDRFISIGPELLRGCSRAEQLQTAVHEVRHAVKYAELVGELRRVYETDRARFEQDRAKYQKDEDGKGPGRSVWWDAADPVGDLARREAFRLRDIWERKDLRGEEGPAKPLSKAIEKAARYWREEAVVERESLQIVQGYLRRQGEAESELIRKRSDEYVKRATGHAKLFFKLREYVRVGAPYEKEADRALDLFRDRSAAAREALGPDVRNAPRPERLRATLASRPIFGGVVFGSGADPASVRVLEAKIALEGGEPYLDLLVDGPGGRQRCRYEPLSATELWAAYHVVRPSAAMRERCGLDGRELGLISCDVDPMGIEGRFAIHPALADNYVGLMGQRLDLLVAAGAPGLFDDVDYTRYAMQWYDESARLRAEEGRLVVEAAAGPPHVLLRARFWGHDQTPPWLAGPLRLNVSGLLPAAPTGWLDLNSRQERIALEVSRRVWERLGHGQPGAEGADGHVTREQYLREKDRALAEVMKDLAANLPLDSGPVIAAAYHADPSLYLMDHFARTLAVLRWIADARDVAFPDLPAEVQPVRIRINPRVAVVDLIEDLRAAVPAPVPSAPDEGPAEQVKYDREWWYVIHRAGVRRGYRHDTLRTTLDQGKPGVLFERRDHLTFPQQEGIAVAERKLSALHPLRWKLWPERLRYEAQVGTEEPFRYEGRVDEKDSRKLVVTETTGDETKTSRRDRPLHGFPEEETVRVLLEEPLKAGEEKWVHGHSRLRAVGMEATEVLGEQRRLLRVEWTAFEGADEEEATLWVDAQGVIVKQVTRGRRPMTYCLTSREVALAAPREEPPAFPRSVPLVKVEPAVEEPDTIERLRLRVHLKEAIAGSPFPKGPGQAVTRIDPRTFEIELRRPRPADIPPPLPTGGPTAVTSPGPDDRPLSPARQRAELARMKARMERLDRLLRDGGRLPPGEPLEPEPEPDEYHEPNDFIQSDHPLMVALASIALPGSRDSLRVAADLEWTVFGMLGKSYRHPYLSAAQALLAREGDCSEHAALLVALARARGIGARLVTGFRYAPDLEAFVAHQWAEVEVNGGWWPLDATLGRGAIGATHLKTDDSPGLYPEDDAPNLRKLLDAGIGRIEVVAVERVKPGEAPKSAEPVFPPDSPRPYGLGFPPGLPRPAVPGLPGVDLTAPRRNGKPAAFDLGVFLADWVGLQDMRGPGDRDVALAWEGVVAAARELDVAVPPPGPSQHRTDLALLNTVAYLSRRAEPRLAPVLRERHGKEAEACFLFATRARTLARIQPLLSEEERALRCEELGKLARTCGIAETHWKPFTEMVRRSAPIPEIHQQLLAMVPLIRASLADGPPTPGGPFPPVAPPAEGGPSPPPLPPDTRRPAGPPLPEALDPAEARKLAEARKVLERLEGVTADRVTIDELTRLIAAREVLAEVDEKIASARALVERLGGRPVGTLTREELEAFQAAQKLLPRPAGPQPPAPPPPIPGPPVPKVEPGPGPFPPAPPPIPGPPAPKVEPPSGPAGPEVRTGDAKDMLGVWVVTGVRHGGSARLDPLGPTVIVLQDHMVTFDAGGDPGRIIPYRLGKATADYSEIQVGDLAPPARVRMNAGVVRATSHRLQIAFVRAASSRPDQLARQLDGKELERDTFVWLLERRDRAEVKAGRKDEKKALTHAELARAFSDLGTIQGTWEEVNTGRIRLAFDRGEVRLHDGRFRSSIPIKAGPFSLNPLTEPGTLVLALGRSSQTVRYALQRDRLVLYFGHVRPDDENRPPPFPGAPGGPGGPGFPPIGPGPGIPPGGIGLPVGPPPGAGPPGGIGMPPGGPPGVPVGPGIPGDPGEMPPQAAETVIFKRVVPKK